MKGLTSGFGMEPGVPPSLWTPTNSIRYGLGGGGIVREDACLCLRAASRDEGAVCCAWAASRSEGPLPVLRIHSRREAFSRLCEILKSCENHQILPGNCREERRGKEASFRPVSTGQLNVLPHVHFRPIDLVVYQGSFVLLQGYLILRQASRLDAFSGYIPVLSY